MMIMMMFDMFLQKKKINIKYKNDMRWAFSFVWNICAQKIIVTKQKIIINLLNVTYANGFQ